MFDPKLKLTRDLFDKLTAAAAQLGAPLEEFCAKVLEREADKVLGSSGKKEVSEADVAKITSKLKGLGYLE